MSLTGRVIQRSISGTSSVRGLVVSGCRPRGQRPATHPPAGRPAGRESEGRGSPAEGFTGPAYSRVFDATPPGDIPRAHPGQAAERYPFARHGSTNESRPAAPQPRRHRGARSAPRRARCSARSASPRKTSTSRRSASRRRGTRSRPATSTSTGSRTAPSKARARPGRAGRVHDYRRLGRDRDGARRHARVARPPRDHRRLRRAGRSRGTLRRPGHDRRLRQVAARDGDGRSSAESTRACSSTAARSSPGQFQGKDVTIQDVFEAVGAHAAGHDDRRRAARARAPGLPRRRLVRRHVHREHDGDRAGGARRFAAGQRLAARRSTRGATSSRARAARRCSISSSKGSRPRDIITKRALENAIAPSSRAAARRTRCCTCWRSRTRSALELEIDDFDRIARRTPIIADMKPWGRFVMLDIDRCGGVPAIMRELLDAGTARRRRADRDRQDGRGEPRGRRRARPTSDVVKPIAEPISPTGGFAILRGSLAPEGCVAKMAGLHDSAFKGPARVFDREEDAFDAVTHGRIVAGDVIVIRYEGPRGGPGMREMLAVHRGGERRRARGPRLPDHRRPVLGCDPRQHGRPHRSRGRATADRSRSFARATRSCSTSRTGSSRSTSPPTSSSAAWRTGRRRRPATPRARWPSTRAWSRAPAEAPSAARPCRKNPPRLRRYSLTCGDAG